jgi:predicted  nucleic acid-binding Zn-ribbon protein
VLLSSVPSRAREALALHRETLAARREVLGVAHASTLASASEERQILAAKENAVLAELLKQNTQLTEITQKLTEKIEALTREMHRKVVEGGK